VIIPVVQLPVVQAYWLGALAYLLTGRWPSGVPKAWSTGLAEPWPSAAELRERRAEGIQRQSRPRPGRKSAAAPEPEPEPEPVAARTTRANTSKRKRKRRH
jgi:hypothetical protein